MARELKDLAGNPIGALDSEYAIPLSVQKAMDITEDCPDREEGSLELILFYGTDTDRHKDYVQVTDRVKGRNFGLDVVYFFPISDDLLQDKYIRSFADKFGLTSPQLIEMIAKHQPSQ